MKKIFLIIGIFICIIGYGQTSDPVDQDSIDATQEPTNAMYGLVFDNTAKKIYHMTSEYYWPWKAVPPLLYPRSIASNVLIGTTVNTYNDKFFVNGNMGNLGNAYFMGSTYFGSARVSKIWALGTIGNAEMYFYSPTAGTYSLTELATFDSTVSILTATDTLVVNDIKIYEGTDSLRAKNGNGAVFNLFNNGGGINLTQVPDYAIVSENNGVAYGATNFIHKTGTIKVLPALSDTGMYVLVPASGDLYSKGLLIRNESSVGYGISINNTTSGTGIDVLNTTSGHAITGDQWPGATGSWMSISRPTGATGEAISINSATGATGNVISITKNGVAQVSIGDSIFANYLDGSPNGSRFGVFTITGALDSGVLNAVRRGLEDKIWDVHKVLKDRKNGEIRWVYIDDITGDTASTYGLPNGMNAFEALQYAQEMSLRLLAEQDITITKQDSLISDFGKNLDEMYKRISLLERKEYRMNRQDYKYKAKLLKLENRLK